MAVQEVMNLVPAGDSTPAERVSNIAAQLDGAGVDSIGTKGALWTKLSSLMCWDAALYLAWSVKGIDSNKISMTSGNFGLVSASEFDGPNQLFHNASVAKDLAEAKKMPIGCFVGFVKDRTLRHCMIHIKDGRVGGTKNKCVIPSASEANIWETFDIAEFFSHSGNQGTNVIFKPVTLQQLN